MRTDDTVGRLGISGNPLDVALAEKGYFQMKTPEGIKLTRDGRFKMTKEGEILALDGSQVLTDMGTPLKLPIIPESIEDINIDLSGTVRVLNRKTRKFELAGNLSVVNADGSIVLNPNIRQGYNEYSNVTLETEFLEALPYPKTFNANLQLYKMQNTNIQRAISSLGS